MNRLSAIKKIAAGLLFLGAAFVVGNTAAQASDMDAVKAANQAFYTALSTRDIGAMQKVWSSDNEVINIGPRHKTANVGWVATKKSFEETFDAAPMLNASMEQPQIRINGQVAWVSGIEKGQRQSKSGEKQTIDNYGTNVFVNQSGRWVMVSHHASARSSL